MKSKIIASGIVADVLREKTSLLSAFPLPKHVEKKALIQEMCFGVCRWFYQLDFIAKQLLKKPFEAKDYDIYAIILIGLYQLMYMKTPENIVVSESVDAVKKINKTWASGLINATLRNFLRQKNALLDKAEKNVLAKYAHPQWLTDKIKTFYPEDWESILIANNQHPPMSLRVNRLKISREDYLKKLVKEGTPGFLCEHVPCGLILEKPDDVRRLPGFDEGEFFVQDCAAQLAAECLDLKKDQTVLDACSAPGGKTTHILEIEPGIKKLISVDHDDKRLKKVKENCERLFKNPPRLSSFRGLPAESRNDLSLDPAGKPRDDERDGLIEKISIQSADMNNVKAWWDGELFDRILLDAPCSAVGVIRRHPDIKLMRKKDDVPFLAKQQRQLLKTLWSTLKENGKLLYVTCSILPDENEKVIERFLKETPDAKEIPIEASWGIKKSFGRQILPGESNMDGFYFVLVSKNG